MKNENENYKIWIYKNELLYLNWNLKFEIDWIKKENYIDYINKRKINMYYNIIIFIY